MEEGYVLKIPLSDEGPLIELKNWAELDRWLSAEQEAWSWLSPQGNGTNIANIGDQVQSRLSSIAGSSRNWQAQGHELANIAPEVASTFNGTRGPVLPSASKLGQAILDVRGLAGDEGAAAAYAFSIGTIAIANVSNPRQLLGVLASTFPAFEQSTAIADRLSKERTNAKAAAKTLTNELRADAERRDEEWQELLKRAGGIGRRMLRRRRKSWEAQQAHLAQQQIDAVSEIKAVQQAFEESMRLQAPVQYWEKKAEKHRNAEAKAIGRLQWFFPLAALLLGAAFALAGWALVSTEQQHPAVYIVISGGLALASTLGLWIGRILTKLYLSEHHLRNDADERAVMTTTYLALTREQAADTNERQIILGALFRNTPDGIVKEDGPVELNIAAILSRLGVR